VGEICAPLFVIVVFGLNDIFGVGMRVLVMRVPVIRVPVMRVSVMCVCQ
jgi:hypothetical protein